MPVSDVLDHLLLFLTTFYTTYISPFLPAPLASTISTIGSTVASTILPVLRSGDLPSIAALLVILYLSLRTLDYIRRSVMGWVWFVLQLGAVVAMMQLVYYVNAYGWEKALEDAGWVAAMLWGSVEGTWKGSEGDLGGKYNVGGGRGGGGYRQQAFGLGGQGRAGRERWN